MNFDHNIVAALVRRLGGKVQITDVDLVALNAGHLEWRRENALRQWTFIYREEHDAPLKVDVRDGSGRALDAVLLEAPE